MRKQKQPFAMQQGSTTKHGLNLKPVLAGAGRNRRHPGDNYVYNAQKLVLTSLPEKVSSPAIN
ncbi:hypothetical protein [Kalamiella sp. sgz302252]|uniref:hypothetical protein n=1 Tax=Pantoea sp. sgz302252 TaxID=3341827 RepID=UPI0036D27257